MLQVIQSYRTGEVSVREVPAPRCYRNGILVRNTASLISIGTERSIIELGRKSLIGKARARPDLLKRAIEKAQREGYWKTFQEALARMDTPTPLGYSCAGVVLEAGTGAQEFAPGDRVACVGNKYASHAEFVSVPANMACRIPEGVSDEEAAFAMLGAIAMHGVREANLSPGSTVAVLGLGLLGLITVQILHAYGYRIVAMDLDGVKAEMAKTFGALASVKTDEEITTAANSVTTGLGCDAVIVTAATNSSAPVDLGVALLREKGRLVVVGVADIHPNRNEMWHKEVEIVVSKAGGAGAIDPIYEIDGIDLPIAYARWTQGRNMAEFLRLAAEGLINLKGLITHRFALEEAQSVYESVLGGTLKGAIGIVLKYPGDRPQLRSIKIAAQKTPRKAGEVTIGVVGAGQFGGSVLLPALKKASSISLKVVVTSSGISAEHSARRFGFEECSTEADSVFERDDIDVVFDLTPHSQHARNVLAAIRTGKHLFVEKPLCISPEELSEITEASAKATNMPQIMVGHNRRYSPHASSIRRWLSYRRGPLVMSIRINAGYFPPEHWVHQAEQGRSRLVGEMTHFVDFAVSIVKSPVAKVSAMRVAGDGRTIINNDNVSVNIQFEDSSVANIVYTAQGSRRYPREHYEIYSEGRVIVSTDFRRTIHYGPSRTEIYKSGSQVYGYEEEIAHFLAAVRGQAPLEPEFASALAIMNTSFMIEESLARGVPVPAA